MKLITLFSLALLGTPTLALATCSCGDISGCEEPQNGACDVYYAESCTPEIHNCIGHAYNTWWTTDVQPCIAHTWDSKIKPCIDSARNTCDAGAKQCVETNTSDSSIQACLGNVVQTWANMMQQCSTAGESSLFMCKNTYGMPISPYWSCLEGQHPTPLAPCVGRKY